MLEREGESLLGGLGVCRAKWRRRTTYERVGGSLSGTVIDSRCDGWMRWSDGAMGGVIVVRVNELVSESEETSELKDTERH